MRKILLLLALCISLISYASTSSIGKHFKEINFESKIEVETTAEYGSVKVVKATYPENSGIEHKLYFFLKDTEECIMEVVYYKDGTWVSYNK